MEEHIDLERYRKVEVRKYQHKGGDWTYKCDCPYCRKELVIMKEHGKVHCSMCGKRFWLDQVVGNGEERDLNGE